MNQPVPADVQVKLNFDALHVGFSYRIKTILERATIALEGVAQLAKSPEQLPGISFPNSNIKLKPRRPLDDVRPDVSAWIVASAVRDWLEEVHAFLEATRRMCAAVTLTDKGTRFSLNDLLDHVDGPAVEFDKLGFRKKLKALKAYGDVLDDLADSVVSLVDARNCIVHRLGVVGQRDITAGQSNLVVRWQSMRVWAQNPGEAPCVVTPEKSRVEVGGSVFVRSVEVVRHYALNDRVTLNTADLCDIWMTLRAFGVGTAQKVWKMAQSKGFTDDFKGDRDAVVSLSGTQLDA